MSTNTLEPLEGFDGRAAGATPLTDDLLRGQYVGRPATLKGVPSEEVRIIDARTDGYDFELKTRNESGWEEWYKHDQFFYFGMQETDVYYYAKGHRVFSTEQTSAGYDTEFADCHLQIHTVERACEHARETARAMNAAGAVPKLRAEIARLEQLLSGKESK